MTANPQNTDSGGTPERTEIVEKRVAATVIRRRARVVEPPAPVEPPKVEAPTPVSVASPASAQPTSPTPTTAAATPSATAPAVGLRPVMGATPQTPLMPPRSLHAGAVIGTTPRTAVTPGVRPPLRAGVPGAVPPKVAEPEVPLKKPLRRKKSRSEWEEEDIRRAGGFLSFADEIVGEGEEGAVVDPLLAETEVSGEGVAVDANAAAVAATETATTPETTVAPVVAVAPTQQPVNPPPHQATQPTVSAPTMVPRLPSLGPSPFPRSGMMERVFRPTGGKRKKGLRKDFKKTVLTEMSAEKRIIKIEDSISVSGLSQRMGVKAGELLKQLMQLGTMVTINQMIDIDTASLLATEYGFEVERTALNEDALLAGGTAKAAGAKGATAATTAATAAADAADAVEAAKDLVPRPPVVTVMGHVDHGKTSLLDAIRATDIAAGEAGGITQHIGASEVKTPKGIITFLDTPGHEAFTALRARGAQVTDIVVLVVAADDGVMPQTVEAINHAKAAQVPVIVAMNKCDKPEAAPDRVKRELSENGIVPEEWGGDAICIATSAKSKQGVDQLLETILLQAEMLQLTANPKGPAKGVVIEAKLDKGRGPVATVVMQDGTVTRGMIVVCGTTSGRVRALQTSRGETVESAGPGFAVELLGLDSVPQAGDPLLSAADERAAKVVIDTRTRKQRELEMAKSQRAGLDALMASMKTEGPKVLTAIIKGDVHGSVEAVNAALTRVSTERVKIDILHHGVGGITESDILLASASNALVIGFNVMPDGKARRLAATEKVEIKTYSIIYELIDDVKKAMAGLLEPTRTEKLLGQADVRQVFTIGKSGMVAGCMVTSGAIVRSARVRLLRDSAVVFSGKIDSLKRFKDDAKEVQVGQECGIALEGFKDIKPGDVIESFLVEETAAVL